MKRSKWMVTCLALGLAVIMAWAVPAMAQGRWGGWGRGGGYCQGRGMGPGGGYGYGGYGGSAYCPNYPGYQGGSWYGNNYTQAPQARRGMQGRGRYNQPATPPQAPADNQ